METITCAAIILIAVAFGYIVSLGERAVRAIEGSPTREQIAHLYEAIISVRNVIDGIPTPDELAKNNMPAGMYFPANNEDGISAYVPMSAVKAITK